MDDQVLRHEDLEQVWADAVRNSVWAVSPVSKEPSITLIRWRIVEVKGGRHCVGYNVTWMEGRVSSKIVTFDPSLMRAVTESGRVYQLEGEPGWDADADYVLGLWLAAQSFKAKDAIDVTRDILSSPTESSELTPDGGDAE